MPETLYDVTFGFRFLALSADELSLLRNKLPNVEFIARQREAGLVVSFDLDENVEVGSLVEFIGESIGSANSYSVWISLTSSSDQGGVSLPEHVLAVIRETSCGVDFSFAACLGEHK